MKTLSIAKYAVSAVVVAVGLSITPAASAAATPETGVTCPVGFTPSFDGVALKCVKHGTNVVEYSNTDNFGCRFDPNFTVFRRMVGQKDICMNQNVDIGSNDSLASFENGQVVLTLPPSLILPIGLRGRPVQTNASGARIVRLNANADFIFFESSSTMKSLAASHAKAVEIATERANNLPDNAVTTKVVSITTTVDGTGGSLDKVTVAEDTFRLPQ